MQHNAGPLVHVIPESLRRPAVRCLLARFTAVARVRPHEIGLALGLALVAMALEAASFGVLVPLADAFSANSFEPLAESRFFGWLADLIPTRLESSTQRDGALVLLLLVLIIALRLMRAVVLLGLRRYMHRREERYLARIKHFTFTRVLTHSRAFFDRRALGRLDVEISWANAFVDLLAEAERLIERLFGLLGKAVVLIALSLPLSLTLLVAIPLIQATARGIGRAIERESRAGDEVERRIHTQVLDLLGAVTLVKASGAEHAAARDYEALLQQALGLRIRRRDLQALRWPVEEGLLLITLLVAQGVMIIAAGSFQPGDLARTAAFLLIVSQLLPDLKQFSLFSTAVAERVPRLEALADLIADDPHTQVRSGPRSFETLHEGIRIEGLRFGYDPDHPVLHDLDLTVPAGHTTALVGETGSGKSTLVKLLARLYEYDTGRITFDGIEAREYSLESLYRHLSLVSQEVLLLNRSLRDNLTYGLERPVDDAELLGMLATVELGDWTALGAGVLERELGDRGLQLSGGQRQRLALARALLREPEILLLDEATAALDSVVEARIARTLVEATRGRTVVVVAHRLSTVRDADHIVVLHRGRIVEQGRWNELLELDGAFAALHAAQFGVGGRTVEIGEAAVEAGPDSR